MCHQHDTGNSNKNVTEWNLRECLGRQTYVCSISYYVWYEKTGWCITFTFQICFRALLGGSRLTRLIEIKFNTLDIGVC